MKKLFLTGLAVLAAGLLASSLVACSNSSDDDDDNIAYNSSGSSDSSVAYTGSMTANGTSYTSLTMTGSSTSGTAVLAGSSGTVSGTYARAVAASANTLDLSGSYTLSFDFGTVTIAVNNDVVVLSAGSAAAGGSGNVRQDNTNEPLTTLNGKTFVCPVYMHTIAYREVTPHSMKEQIYTLTDSCYITGTSDSEATVKIWAVGPSAGAGNWNGDFVTKSITYTISGTTITFTCEGITSTGTITGSGSFTIAGSTVERKASALLDNNFSRSDLPAAADGGVSSLITGDMVFIEGNAPSAGKQEQKTTYY